MSTQRLCDADIVSACHWDEWGIIIIEGRQ